MEHKKNIEDLSSLFIGQDQADRQARYLASKKKSRDGQAHWSEVLGDDSALANVIGTEAVEILLGLTIIKRAEK
jgi:hypothetical protein